MINVGSMPQIAAFAQGGYGKPALNMFNQDADFFAIVGLRLNWNIGSFYTKSNNSHQIEINNYISGLVKEINERAEKLRENAQMLSE